jgi:hypothetical protein
VSFVAFSLLHSNCFHDFETIHTSHSDMLAFLESWILVPNILDAFIMSSLE